LILQRPWTLTGQKAYMTDADGETGVRLGRLKRKGGYAQACAACGSCAGHLVSSIVSVSLSTSISMEIDLWFATIYSTPGALTL